MNTFISIVSAISVTLSSAAAIPKENPEKFHDLVYRGEKWDVIYAIPRYEIINLEKPKK